MKTKQRNNLFMSILLVSLILGLTSCNLPRKDKNESGEMPVIMTSAAGTASVQLTQIVVDGYIQQLTKQAATPTMTTTATPQPGLTLPANTINTPIPTPCYAIKFIADVSIPDGTQLAPGEAFTKTWRLKNNGTCTWQANTQLVFVSGNAMNGQAAKEIGQVVTPGQTIDISIAQNAPNGDGTYTGYYQLRSPDGVRFGLGANADVSFWVKINVNRVTYEMDPAHPLDFDYNICAAKWTTTAGKVSCSAANVDYTSGSVRKTNNPILEGGYQEDEGTILVSPSSGNGGMVMGQFPMITLANGDHFASLIGCVNDRPDCNVLFELQYLDSNGTLYGLGSWSEKSDGQFTHVDVDLSSLSGKSVALILKVSNNGNSTGDEVFWVSPAIVR